MSALPIADTGVVVAYLNRRDQDHEWAVSQFERYPWFLTCEAVLAEAAHLAGHPKPIADLMARGVLRVGYTARGDEQHLAALLTTYSDTPMDFADACLVRMSELQERSEVVTLDSDFLIYRKHGREPIPLVMP